MSFAFGGFGAAPTGTGGTGAATSSFSFGAPAAATTSTGFGAPAAATSTGFGAPAATTGGFGGFGSSTGFGSSGFGAAPAGGVGTAGATAAPSFGGFGASLTSPTPAPPATSGGFAGFGAPAVPATTSTPAFGGFGTGTFGATNTSATKPATSGFGTLGGGFGNLGSGFGGFGGFASNVGGVPAVDTSASLPQRPDQFPGGDKIDDIQRSYAPVLDAQTLQPLPAGISGRTCVTNEKSCKFDTIFYSHKQASGLPLQQSNSGPRWEQAEYDNPDPEKLEPVRELGIAGLKKRFEDQGTDCAKYRKQATELREVLETIEKSTRRTSLKVEALKAKQAQLYNRMLSVVRSVEVLRCRGVPVDSSERRLVD